MGQTRFPSSSAAMRPTRRPPAGGSRPRPAPCRRSTASTTPGRRRVRPSTSAPPVPKPNADRSVQQARRRRGHRGDGVGPGVVPAVATRRAVERLPVSTVDADCAVGCPPEDDVDPEKREALCRATLGRNAIGLPGRPSPGRRRRIRVPSGERAGLAMSATVTVRRDAVPRAR